MLTLWARTAQHPGCHRCISCVSNSASLTGRVGAASIKGPWILRTPTSTFLYTTVFAAGLAIDGRAKHKRNEQWDTAFSQLQEQGEKPSSSADEDHGHLADSTGIVQEVQEENESIIISRNAPLDQKSLEGVDWESVHRRTGNDFLDPDIHQNYSEVEIDLEDVTNSLWRLIDFDTKFPRTQVLKESMNTGPELIRHNLPPQSIWAWDHAREKALRKRQTWKKIAIQELSIGYLLHCLIAHIRIMRLPARDIDALPPTIQQMLGLWSFKTHRLRQDLLSNIEKVQCVPEDLPAEEVAQIKSNIRQAFLPSYQQDDDGAFHDVCQAMNASIKKLLLRVRRRDDDSQVALTLAGICHDLLVSSAAPDVHTFNILLTGLKRWKLYKAVDEVIPTLLVCQIRPNEITCAAILDHYIRCNRPEEFTRFVAKMRGVGDALMMANPRVKINEASNGRLVRVSDKKVYQKVYPTPMVFNMLMLGALKFAGFERALEIYFEMKEDNWGMDVHGLSHFLLDCVHRADWQGGLVVWQEIASIKSPSNVRHVRHLEQVYSNMLGLCRVTGNSAAFNQILKEVVNQGLDHKKILRSATSVVATKASQMRSFNTPAWTADNVLIAMGDYLGIDSGPDQTREPSVVVEAATAKESGNTWEKWLDQELRRTPKD